VLTNMTHRDELAQFFAAKNINKGVVQLLMDFIGPHRYAPCALCMPRPPCQC
jgi:hypothetical protein